MAHAAGRTVVALASLAVLLARAPSARAEDDDHRLSWDFPRFHEVEYGVTAALFVELAFIEFRTTQPDQPRWTGPILLDEPVRDAFRLKSASARNTVNAISDPMTLGLQILPAAIDGIVVPLVFDDWNIDVAWQMSMVNALGLGLQGFLQRFSLRTVARERPDVAECRNDPEYSSHCGGGETSSFYSGHVGGAFAGAGLMCAHHLHLPLLGGGAPDVVACAVPMVMASSVGVIRVLGDRHYFSDVAVGAWVGLVSGYALPVLLHYSQPEEGDVLASGLTVTPWAAPRTAGVSMTGLF
ncbi:MAG: phosphatase PAP2 family protein [Polyangiaceae bacterium]